MEFPSELLLPPLPFGMSDLEPIISRTALESHYLGNHKGYVDKYNELIKDPNSNQVDLQFNYNGHLLHTLFWNSLSPGPKIISGKLKNKLQSQLGENYESILKSKIIQAAMKIKGSGWVALTYDVVNKLIRIRTIPNHELEKIGKFIPLLVIDGWEHSMYFDYLNDKKSYMENLYNFLLNWHAAETRFISI